MLTHTHILIGAALFARPGARAVAAAAAAGSVIPDLDVATMWIVERANGVSSHVIFRDRFWESPWVEMQAVFNSAPLWALFALCGLALSGRRGALFAFGAAGFLHVVGDFLLHADDARAHLQPFTSWRFYSPISYWDPAKSGRIVGAVEAAAGLALVVLLWRRFIGWRVRGALSLTAALYVAGLGATLAYTGEGHDHAIVRQLETNEAADVQ